MLAMATRASAQTVTYDSIPIDSAFYAADPTYLDSIEGAPNHMQAHMGEGDIFAVQFAINQQVVTMDSGATLHVYWNRVSSDSCAMDIQFQDYNFSGTPRLGPTVHMIESGPENVWNMTTILVPNSGYNTLQLSLGVNPNPDQPGADSCFLDAIELVQNGSAAVGQYAVSQQPTLLNYPNPFYHSSGTNVRIHATSAGMGMLSVVDALGREVNQVALGELSPGDREVSLAMEAAGVYFVRLLVDGVPSGAPLQISGE